MQGQTDDRQTEHLVLILRPEVQREGVLPHGEPPPTLGQNWGTLWPEL